MTLAAVILAGGRSSRMGGGDKTLLDLGGQSILARVIERLRPQCHDIALNANGDPARLATFGLPVLSDEIDGFAGPLAGLQSGLAWAAQRRATQLLTVASDTPFFSTTLAASLSKAAEDTVAVAASAGRWHPTFALWPVSFAADLDDYLASGGRRVVSFIERHPHVIVEFGSAILPGGPVDPFFNINTPADLAEARRLVTPSGA